MTKKNSLDFRGGLLLAAKVMAILVPTLILVFGLTGAAAGGTILTLGFTKTS